LAPPTYLAAPEVADYHAIALCEHVAGGDIGVFGTHIRARVIHADVGPSFQFEWLFPLVQGDRQHPGERVVRSHSRYLRFFSLFFSTRPKEFF